MSQLKVNAIRHTGASSDAITLASDGTATYAATNGTSNFTISDGNLVIGTSGHGIDFSATSDGAGATSEVLHDYEEGSFTPTYDAPDQSSATFSHYQNYGKYTKIGNIVTVGIYISGYCNGNAGGGSNDDLKVTGLPFAPASNTGSGDGRNTANFTIGNRYKLECDDLTAYCYAGNTYIDLLVPSNGGTGTMLKTNQADQNTTQFFATASYRVS
tara:strand:+ start:280 stop:921 length:642 start_codon:yes stop_codon:yes gene_type:complete